MINKKLVWRAAAQVGEENFTITDLVEELCKEVSKKDLIDEKVYYNPQNVLKCVSTALTISEDKLKAKSRIRYTVKARQVAMYLIYKYTHLTTTKTGDVFNKDHATVIHAVKTVKDGLKGYDQEVKQMAETCEKFLLMENPSYTKKTKCVSFGCDEKITSDKSIFCRSCYHRDYKQKKNLV